MEATLEDIVLVLYFLPSTSNCAHPGDATPSQMMTTILTTCPVVRDSPGLLLFSDVITNSAPFYSQKCSSLVDKLQMNSNLTH